MNVEREKTDMFVQRNKDGNVDGRNTFTTKNYNNIAENVEGCV